MRDLNFMRRAVIRLTPTCFGLSLMLLIIANVTSVLASTATSDVEGNRLLSVSQDSKDGQTVVKLQTENPVGYRYTVYDSFDPTRVVIDFPGMDVGGVPSITSADVKPLQSIRASALSLPSATV